MVDTASKGKGAPDRAARWISLLLLLSGVVLIAFAVSTDALGIGSPGFGRVQGLVALLGLACLGSALALRSRTGEHLLDNVEDRGPATIGFREMWVLVMCFSLVCGLADTGLWYIQNAAGHRFNFVPVDYVWMSVSSYFVFLAPPTLVAWLVGRFALGSFGSERVIAAGLTALGVVGLASNYHPELALWTIFILSAGVTATVWRHAGERSGWYLRVSNRVAAPSAVLVLALAVTPIVGLRLRESLATSSLPNAAPGARNVLLIILDTVRARNMSLHGYERATTPYLDSLARSSVVFDRAYAPSSWTLPTHASIFTGLQPDDLSANWLTPLNAEPATLAEAFASRGYRSAGFVGNQGYAGPHTGLDRGFSHYETGYLHPRTILGASMLGRLVLLGGWQPWGWEMLRRKPGSAVTEQFLGWLPERGGAPFFVFLNYYDAHDPYVPPEPFADHFAGDAVPVRPVHGPDRPRLQAMIRGYDASIAYLDAELRRLMSELRRRGHLENTVVVITSDHGEEFAEKGAMTHGTNLNASVLHVPLIVVLPGRRAEVRIRRPVSLRDLAATLLEISRSGGDPDDPTDPMETLPGRSFASYLSVRDSSSTPGGSAEDTLLAEMTGFRVRGTSHFRGYLVSAITSSLHYVVDGTGDEDLFALESDWWEQENLADRPEYGNDLERFRAWTAPARLKLGRVTVPRSPEERGFPGRRIEVPR